MKRDDSSLDPDDLGRIEREARALLERADAIGCLPTPIDRILEVAEVTVANEETLSEGYLVRLRREAKGALKRAITKVQGLFDSFSRVIHIDKTVRRVRQTFLKLHETAHGFLAWQRKLYGLTEDCEKHLDDSIKDLFEREASNFASEVLFQLDHFTHQAADHPFGIKVPMRLAPKYGASIYAAIRRYVRRNPRACAVIVLEQPELKPYFGFTCAVRRVVCSPAFEEAIGNISWPEVVTPDDRLGALVPVTRKMTGRRLVPITDANGIQHDCIAEALNNTVYVFVLLLLAQQLTKTTIVLPDSAAF